MKRESIQFVWHCLHCSTGFPTRACHQKRISFFNPLCVILQEFQWCSLQIHKKSTLHVSRKFSFLLIVSKCSKYGLCIYSKVSNLICHNTYFKDKTAAFEVFLRTWGLLVQTFLVNTRILFNILCTFWDFLPMAFFARSSAAVPNTFRSYPIFTLCMICFSPFVAGFLCNTFFV